MVISFLYTIIIHFSKKYYNIIILKNFYIFTHIVSTSKGDIHSKSLLLYSLK